MVHLGLFRLAAAGALGTALLTACSSGGGMPNSPAPMQHVSPASAIAQPLTATSILATLTSEQTIGSTTPSTPGDVNPYGLDVAKTTAGKISAGDLVVCDFNDPGNVQGTGNEIVALHPVVGSTPALIAKDDTLTGCDALATGPAGDIWLAAFKANDNPIFSPDGMRLNALRSGPWDHPFGEAFARTSGGFPVFYVSNAGNGTIVRATVVPGPSVTFTVIATGFPVNNGKPGSILGPSGLNYRASRDRLYVVDGTNNTLYAIDNVSTIGANGIAVNANGQSFTGPSASDAHVIYSGPPLNGPISSAVFFNGNIALGNTLDPDGQNLIVEIGPGGKLLFVKNVDTGAAGALFGMVATGTSAANTKLYFNDDNDNTVKVLSQ